MAAILRSTCALACVLAVSSFQSGSMFGSRVQTHRPFLCKGPSMAVLKPELIPFASALGKKKIPDKKAWAVVPGVKKPAPGKAAGGLATAGSKSSGGLDICIVCDKGGKLYALGNKAPPTGQPLEFGKVDSAAGTISDPTFGTKFSLKTGQVVGQWMPGGVGFLLKNLFNEPSGVSVFPVRAKGDKVEVQINVNALVQFEQPFWKGILDAQGLDSGSYY